MRGILALVVGMTVVTEAAYAIGVGDVVALGNGVGETIIALRRPAPETIELTLRTLAANASEFCERNERVTSGTPQWRRCVRDNASTSTRILTVNCRPPTIRLARGRGAELYRPGPESGPWISIANPDWIIQGDDVYARACGRR